MRPWSHRWRAGSGIGSITHRRLPVTDHWLSITDTYEATISAIENSPETAARISKPQLEQKRAGHSAQPPSHWEEAADAGLGTKGMGVEKPEGLGLGRKARIKQSRDFARLRREAQRAASGCLIANWGRLPAAGHSRLGVITSGKIGNAVNRNRARRLLREVFRLHQHELAQPIELVLVARQSIVGKRFGQVEKDFLTTLRNAGLLK